ncbi:hypothetical protein K474DRAFT_1706977 [Panus rudis PR-1116 ss-1]|nr:hypothetical protein K474DRAFT_1706977 [Panus rudis PR-1116 ss-1]
MQHALPEEGTTPLSTMNPSQTTPFNAVANTLTSELLAEIMELVISEHCDSYWSSARAQRTDTHFYEWLKVTHIYRHWRQVALQTPTLWRRIAVARLDCVDAMLERSNSLSLHVYADNLARGSELREFMVLCHILTTQSNRIEACHLFLNLQLSPSAYELLRIKMADTQLPCLQYFDIEIVSSSFRRDLHRIPLKLHSSPLQEVRISGCTFPIASLSLSNSTTCLSIVRQRDYMISFHEMLAVLQRAPNL